MAKVKGKNYRLKKLMSSKALNLCIFEDNQVMVSAIKDNFNN